jgi:hypothetical protein
MRTMGRITGGLTLLLLPALYGAGCAAPVDSEVTAEESAGAPDEEQVGESADAVGSCHTTTTCPDPKSCGSWSTGFVCGTRCAPANRQCDFQQALITYVESFRSCVLQDNSMCTEYLVSGTVTSCQC